MTDDQEKEEDIVKEYIAANEYHIDQGLLSQKGINKVHREANKYLKLKVENNKEST